MIITAIILGLILAVPLAIITMALPAGWRAGFVNGLSGLFIWIIRLCVIGVVLSVVYVLVTGHDI